MTDTPTPARRLLDFYAEGHDRCPLLEACPAEPLRLGDDEDAIAHLLQHHTPRALAIAGLRLGATVEALYDAHVALLTQHGDRFVDATLVVDEVLQKVSAAQPPPITDQPQA